MFLNNPDIWEITLLSLKGLRIGNPYQPADRAAVWDPARTG